MVAVAPTKRAVATKNLDNFMIGWFSFLNYGYFSLLCQQLIHIETSQSKHNFNIADDEVIVGMEKGNTFTMIMVDNIVRRRKNLHTNWSGDIITA